MDVQRGGQTDVQCGGRTAFGWRSDGGPLTSALNDARFVKHLGVKSDIQLGNKQDVP